MVVSSIDFIVTFVQSTLVTNEIAIPLQTANLALNQLNTLYLVQEKTDHREALAFLWTRRTFCFVRHKMEYFVV